MLVYQEGSSSESWMVLKMKPPNGHVQFTSRGQRTHKPPGFSGIIRFCASVRRARSRFWTNSLNPNGFSLNLREHTRTCEACEKLAQARVVSRSTFPRIPTKTQGVGSFERGSGIWGTIFRHYIWLLETIPSSQD